MIDFLNINLSKRKNKIEFFQLNVFHVLKHSLGFRYIKTKRKSFFLKQEDGIFKEVGFQVLRDDFKKYLENSLKNFNFPEGINFEGVMNSYYMKNPITMPYARTYLRVEPDEIILEEGLSIYF